MITPFVFKSSRLPIIKAKQLQKAFPFLKLFAAQEATARALGYSTWFECTKTGTIGKQSLSDEDAGLAVRVARYYHQAGVLLGLGITPPAADLWVRGWGLTGSPSYCPSKAKPWYYAVYEAALRAERGEMTQEELENDWGEADWSKHPDIDRPVRICDGVVLAPCGKYPHYFVDPAVMAKVPPYLRGSDSAFHYEDKGALLSMMVPAYKPASWQIRRRLEFNRVQHEWHYGEKHPDANTSAVEMLCKAAAASPEAMVTISVRHMPGASSGGMPKLAIACLRGKDFAAFIKDKGVVDPDTVVWYRDVDEAPGIDMYSWLVFMSDRVELPVFSEAGKYKPGAPVFSYPFKEAPMAEDEFTEVYERYPLLDLESDYGSDEDDGGDDDGDGGWDGGSDPQGPAEQAPKEREVETVAN